MTTSIPFEKDRFPTGSGELEITFIGHGSLMLDFNQDILHVDPYGSQADYALLPKADIILLTHEHSDHMDPSAIQKVSKKETRIVLTPACHAMLSAGLVMENGNRNQVGAFTFEAVPAYNLVHRRPDGELFHKKGVGNGYIVTAGSLRIYIAGDTEDIPEMAEVKDVDIAFLPMNLPYTMTPGMVAHAARMLKPRVLYPYHYGSTDPSELTRLLADEKGLEVRIRNLH